MSTVWLYSVDYCVCSVYGMSGLKIHVEETSLFRVSDVVKPLLTWLHPYLKVSELMLIASQFHLFDHMYSLASTRGLLCYRNHFS